MTIDNNTYKDYLPLYLKKGVKVNKWLAFLTNLIVNYQKSMDLVFKAFTFQTDISFNGDGDIRGDNAAAYRSALNYLSNWFGISRNFKYKDIVSGDEAVLKLSDRELFRLLKTQLWKIGFDGTTESLENNLKDAFSVQEGVKSLIIDVYKDPDPASATIRCTYPVGGFTSNDRKLWENGYYNNPVLGITYTYQAVPDNHLIYDLGLIYDGMWGSTVVPLLPEAPPIPAETKAWVINESGTYTLYLYSAEDGKITREELSTSIITVKDEYRPLYEKYYTVTGQILHVWLGVPKIYDGGEKPSESQGE